MEADVINPFIEATVNVLETMAQTEVRIGKPALKVGRQTWGDVTGIIGLAGYQASGNMVLSFDKSSILGIVNKMLSENFKEINDQVVDAVGEITNMISGGAKSKLSETGYFFEMAIPLMLIGKDMEMTQLTKAPIISVPFATDEGSFVLGASLTKDKEK